LPAPGGIFLLLMSRTRASLENGSHAVAPFTPIASGTTLRPAR
jgi:hypothetical protein